MNSSLPPGQAWLQDRDGFRSLKVPSWRGRGQLIIQALYQGPEVREYRNGILKESSESLNLSTVIEKRVCSEKTPNISNMLEISRTADSFGEHP
jgi:hypothetical protein